MNDQTHELWLIYSELKEAENPIAERLGAVINQLNRISTCGIDRQDKDNAKDARG